ncbi:hypothetical protein AB0G48_18265 [Streptomyces rubiginosohelvolus]|uniref:hypothetical protein n=1 Tax=Streptomyces rubiginosohelvolus TaxID=67362 RepID=UPI0033DB7305
MPTPTPSPHTNPVNEFIQALTTWTHTHQHAIAPHDSDTDYVPITVNATTTIDVHPGLLRLLAGEITAALTPQHAVPDLDPADLDPYTGSDGIIYHGNGEPDFEATAQNTDLRKDCNGRAL